LSDHLETESEPKWRPLTKVQRRVLGVLVEKAKTTPDAYPLTLNGLTTGCNQKSNRDPQMSLESWEVEEALEQLREMGAVAEVHGDGRVAKFRHYCKAWMGCEGAEIAVMAELLLRGPQTVGELRGRASRMEKIPDLATLQTLLDELQNKNLVVPLMPKGRGQVVSHGLFSEKEQAAQRAEVGMSQPVSQPSSTTAAPSAATAASASSSSAAAPAAADASVQALRSELNELQVEVARLKKEIEDIWANIS